MTTIDREQLGSVVGGFWQALLPMLAQAAGPMLSGALGSQDSGQQAPVESPYPVQAPSMAAPSQLASAGSPSPSFASDDGSVSINIAIGAPRIA